MKYLMIMLSVMLSIAVTMFFAACGGSGDGPVANTGVPPAMVPPIGGGYNIANCQVGQVFHPSYGCLNNSTCLSQYGSNFGWEPASMTCVQGTLVSSPAGNTKLWGTMSIHNRDTFRNLLQFSGKCSVSQPWLHYSFGFANCDNYSHTGYVSIIQFGQNQVTIYIGGGASGPNSLNTGSWTTGGAHLLIQNQGQIYPINNSTGVKIVSTAAFNLGGGISIEIPQGTLAGDNLNVSVRYQGAEFATATIHQF